MRIASLVLACLLAAPALARDLGAELIAAARDGRVEDVRALLAEGADPNATDAKGRSALQAAAFFGNERTVRLLLGAGADVNHKDKNGGTPLVDAAFGGNEAVVSTLLAAGADTADVARAADTASLRGHTALAAKLADLGGGGGKKKGKKKKKKKKKK